MTPERFQEAASRTKLTQRGKQMAFAHLISGRTMPDIAQEYKVSKQAVHQTVKAVKKAACPEGYIYISGFLPAKLFKKIMRSFIPE